MVAVTVAQKAVGIAVVDRAVARRVLPYGVVPDFARGAAREPFRRTRGLGVVSGREERGGDGELQSQQEGGQSREHEPGRRISHLSLLPDFVCALIEANRRKGLRS
ncbi:hypothetical protein GCM10010518_09470 [Kitasatospora cinereorecta]